MIFRKALIGAAGAVFGAGLWLGAPAPAAAFAPVIPALRQDLSGAQLEQVHMYRRHWRYHHHRHCWRGRHGHMRCRW